MPVDWKAAESYNRLLAATVASMDGQMKLNYKRIADFYGEGATYDAIEGRFRIIKKQAAKLREEVDNGRPVAPERGSGAAGGGGGSKQTTPRKPRTPKKANSGDTVLTGRVSKSSSTSPTNKPTVHVKTEMSESSTSNSTASSYTDADTPASSTDTCVVDNSFLHDSTMGSFDMSGGLGTVADSQLSMMMMDDNFWDTEHIV